MSRQRPIPTPDPAALRTAVRTYYAERLEGGACCSSQPVPVVLEGAADVPSFGCGDPLAVESLASGETVLDLGSGAGFDALRAARAVGPSGRVIGVDMTPAMLARARAAAVSVGADNVEYREGLIEALPVADASVDVVISNCVLNLSDDVQGVLDEAERVVRCGGRIALSDTFRLGPAPAQLDLHGWCACVDGAHDPVALVRQARRAGFVDVHVPEPPGTVARGATYGAVLRGVKPRIDVADAAAVDEGATLLERADLPTDGWRADGLLRWAAIDGERVVGIVALEVHERHGLVRSLVVDPADRQRGFGAALLAHAVRAARRLGLVDVAALTTTVASWLASHGFREVRWHDLAPSVHASDELRGACPTSARAFVLELTTGRG